MLMSVAVCKVVFRHFWSSLGAWKWHKLLPRGFSVVHRRVFGLQKLRWDLQVPTEPSNPSLALFPIKIAHKFRRLTIAGAKKKTQRKNCKLMCCRHTEPQAGTQTKHQMHTIFNFHLSAHIWHVLVKQQYFKQFNERTEQRRSGQWSHTTLHSGRFSSDFWELGRVVREPQPCKIVQKILRKP